MLENPLIGREEERQILEKALNSPKAELVSVIGRRRVGKTFLVKSVYKEMIDFEITGVQKATRKEQLENFTLQLSRFFKNAVLGGEPKNWMRAFHLLAQLLEKKQALSSKKGVVFLDELPWLATHKSGFLKGFSFFWNSWAVDKNIVVVICGSAASWMIKNVVHHKGGLHNRITKRIHLSPLNLAETERFLRTKNFNFDRYQILHLYMAMGGIPHYLEAVEGGKSAAQNIDQICFSKNGLLQDEFSKLYGALFDNPESHLEVVQALSKKHKGLTRSEILQTTNLAEGGGTTKILKELTQSGFITSYYPFGKRKKDSLYRLTDEYSLFYLQFIKHNKSEGKGIWQQLQQTQPYKSWSGYAFESICLKHLPQIKKALGISGVYTNASTFVKKGNDREEGTQIDLLIDRNDHVINICEMKCYNAPFSIDKRMAMALRNKSAIFKQTTKTTKQVFLTMITTFGINPNQYHPGLIDVVLTLDDLFEQE